MPDALTLFPEAPDDDTPPRVNPLLISFYLVPNRQSPLAFPQLPSTLSATPIFASWLSPLGVSFRNHPHLSSVGFFFFFTPGLCKRAIGAREWPHLHPCTVPWLISGLANAKVLSWTCCLENLATSQGALNPFDCIPHLLPSCKHIQTHGRCLMYLKWFVGPTTFHVPSSPCHSCYTTLTS